MTNAGTCAAALSDVRPTVVPPTGAMPVRRTITAASNPPVTDFGDISNDVNSGRFTKIEAEASPALPVPINVTAVSTATALMFKSNVIDRSPAGTVTLDGTETAPWLDDKLTTIPDSGAGPFRETTS